LFFGFAAKHDGNAFLWYNEQARFVAFGAHPTCSKRPQFLLMADQ
jgi:hypothetical protein